MDPLVNKIAKLITMKEDYIRSMDGKRLAEIAEGMDKTSLLPDEMISLNVQIQITPSRDTGVFKIGFKNLNGDQSRIS